ncbi:MAG: NADH-quinone oxidoreductase subunit A [Pseudomonadota bacterium]
MLENYLPILIFLLMASFIGMGAILLGRLLSTNKPSKAKMSAYECGFEAFGDAHMKFDIRYYLVAILFIIFDLEIAFLFPWAITLNSTGMYGLISMGVFLLILTIGFIYEWKKGALEWD